MTDLIARLLSLAASLWVAEHGVPTDQDARSTVVSPFLSAAETAWEQAVKDVRR